MIRGLRTIVACSCFTAILGLLVLCVRSSLSRDTLQGPFIAVFSWRGQLAIHIDSDRKNATWHTASWSDSSLELTPEGQLTAFGNVASWPPTPSLLGFSWMGGTDEPRITFPHWVPIALLALMVAIFKPPPLLRISLRDLFTLTTIVGIALGGVTSLLAWIHRSL